MLCPLMSKKHNSVDCDKSDCAWKIADGPRVSCAAVVIATRLDYIEREYQQMSGSKIKGEKNGKLY